MRVRLIDQLEERKGWFGAEAERCIADLLRRAAAMRFHDPAHLIRLHEAVLFLRAFPHSARVARLADQILLGFPERLRGVDLQTFDDPKVSGVAGTAVSSNFSYEIACSLARRHGQAVSIDWDNYEQSSRLGLILARLLPNAQEVYAVEPYVDWRGFLEKSGHSLGWLLSRVEPLTYDLLEIPVRWEMSPGRSRSGLRIAPSELFYHRGPFIQRREVSLEAEVAGPPIRTRSVASSIRREILAAIVDASAARYRELWGFVHPDKDRVMHARLGRGVDFYYFGLDSEHRLPLRDYLGGMFFSNGVPTGYVEALTRNKRMEIGFNLYYTFRDGETAWVFARVLKVLRQEVGAIRFSVDPYQLGRDNDEGIESGAFWFYRKLGFAPESREIIRLVEREESRIAQQPGYRSPRSVLRTLAQAPVYYSV